MSQHRHERALLTGGMGFRQPTGAARGLVLGRLAPPAEAVTTDASGCSWRPRAAERQMEPQGSFFQRFLSKPPSVAPSGLHSDRTPALRHRQGERPCGQQKGATCVDELLRIDGEADTRWALMVPVPVSPRALTRRTLGRRHTRVGSRHRGRAVSSPHRPDVAVRRGAVSGSHGTLRFRSGEHNFWHPQGDRRLSVGA